MSRRSLPAALALLPTAALLATAPYGVAAPSALPAAAPTLTYLTPADVDARLLDVAVSPNGRTVVAYVRDADGDGTGELWAAFSPAAGTWQHRAVPTDSPDVCGFEGDLTAPGKAQSIVSAVGAAVLWKDECGSLVVNRWHTGQNLWTAPDYVPDATSDEDPVHMTGDAFDGALADHLGPVCPVTDCRYPDLVVVWQEFDDSEARYRTAHWDEVPESVGCQDGEPCPNPFWRTPAWVTPTGERPTVQFWLTPGSAPRIVYRAGDAEDLYVRSVAPAAPGALQRRVSAPADHIIGSVAVGALPDGRLDLVWTEHHAPSGDIETVDSSRVRATSWRASSGWTTPEGVTGTTDDLVFVTAAATGGDGSADAVLLRLPEWDPANPFTVQPNQVQTVRHPASAGWGTPATLMTVQSLGFSVFPSIASDGDGVATLAVGSSPLVASRRSPAGTWPAPVPVTTALRFGLAAGGSRTELVVETGQRLARVVLGAANTPPQTTIVKRPPAKTTARKARFAFTSSEPGSTFRCKIDARPWKPCTSPKVYKELKVGKHTFRVRARDAEGLADPTPAVDTWRIVR